MSARVECRQCDDEGWMLGAEVACSLCNPGGEWRRVGGKHHMPNPLDYVAPTSEKAAPLFSAAELAEACNVRATFEPQEAARLRAAAAFIEASAEGLAKIEARAELQTVPAYGGYTRMRELKEIATKILTTYLRRE